MKTIHSLTMALITAVSVSACSQQAAKKNSNAGSSSSAFNAGAATSSSGASNARSNDNYQSNNQRSSNASAHNASAHNMGNGNSSAQSSAQANLLKQRVIYYEYNKSSIDANYMAVLKAHAQFIKATGVRNVRLEGHADERGTREYNVALSEKRAQMVRRYMIAYGVSPGVIKTTAYGEEMPIKSGGGEQSWRENRRVEIKY